MSALAESHSIRRYWCELAWLGAEAAAPGVLLTLDGQNIESVTRADSPPAGAVRLEGLTIPGLANAHSHAFQRALRGHTHGGSGDFWSWREQMYALVDAIDPDNYLALARATFAEMALAGITVVGEFHYLHHGPGGKPYARANEMGEVIAHAAAEAGIRLTLLDTCYLQGGIDTPLTPAQQRFADPSAQRWAERAGELPSSATMRVGAAIHSVRAVDPASARMVAEWAGKQRAPLHAHVSEQPAENEQCLAAYGVTPVALLGEQSALSPRFTAVHGTHLTPADVQLLGRGEANCCVCPTTERDLADGIGAASTLREAGVKLALGSDSHAVIDLLEEARAMELDERLATRRRGCHSPASLLGAATAGGYASLGWPEGGHLRDGAIADFTTIALDSPRLAGTTAADAPAAAVFVAGSCDVRNVVVAGRDIVREGRHMSIDVVNELAHATAAVRS
jgi:formiminoglutamate deiminase